MADSSSPRQALEEAIRYCGSQIALARLLQVSQPSVSDWVNRMGRLPAEHVLRVEDATGVSRHDLRPDIYPREDAPAQPPVGASPPPAGGSRRDDGLEGIAA